MIKNKTNPLETIGNENKDIEKIPSKYKNA